MLVFDSPKSDVFLATGDQLISLHRAELNGQNVEITNLLGQKRRFSSGLDLADVKHQNSLPLVRVQSHHRQMLFMTQSDLLHRFVGALEAANTFVIDQYPYRRFGTFLHSHQPIFI